MKLAALVSGPTNPDEIRRRLGSIGPPDHLIQYGDTTLLRFGADVPTGGEPPAPVNSTLFADARLDNRAELTGALGLDRRADDDLATEPLIQAAYRRWGPGCASRLLGDFAFLLWDPTARRLVAACDPMAMRPLFHARRGANWAVASTAELALRLLGEPPRVDRAGIAAWLAGQPRPERAVLAGVEALPGGHVLVIENGQGRIERYWRIDPDPPLRYSGIDDYAAHLLELLGRCVADRLPADGPVATQLSGGLDSSTVTALAADAAADRLLAVTHLYHPDSGCDEAALAAETVARLGIGRHLQLPVDGYLNLHYPDLYPPLLDSPGTVLSPRYVDELTELRAQGTRVLLTGSGGDEMTWGHALSYFDRLTRGELGVVAEVARGSREHGLPLLPTLVNLFLRPLVPAPLKKLRRRLSGRAAWPDWIPTAAGRELGLAEAAVDPDRPAFDGRAAAARYDALTNSATYHSVRSYQAAGEQTGVSVCHPFFDRRLVEFSFSIPDDLWLRERYPKWLLRKAMDGRLPDSVNWNRHKVVFDRFFAGLLQSQAPAIRALIAHPGLQDLGLVDNSRLLQAFDRAIEQQPPSVTVDLLHALMAQIWFQRHAGALGYTG